MLTQTDAVTLSASDLLHYLTLPMVFGPLDAETRCALQAEVELVGLAPNHVLFHQGDPGDSLYVLVQGKLAISIQNADGNAVVVDEALPYQMIGEIALLTGQARTATVYAQEEAALVKLSQAGFARLTQQQPELATRLAHNSLPRLRRQQLLAILTKYFGTLEKTTLAEVQKQLEWLELAAGDCLVRQGEPSDAMYIVLNGRLRVTIRPPESPLASKEKVVREVGAGEIVGEIGLLTDAPRTATVTAIRATTVVSLSQSAYTELLYRYPQAILQIARIMAGRQVGVPTARADSSVAATFALLAGDETTPLTWFTQRLYEMLAEQGDTLYLNGPRFEQTFGKIGAAQITPEDPLYLTISSWLAAQETRYRAIIYEADSAWSAWTECCIQQADCILLVKQANGNPKPTACEEELATRYPMVCKELVLLHRDECVRPTGTARWLQPRQVTAHHHVRMTNPGDWQRLVRRLTKRAIGLVLGGGAARGFAHIGVLRALYEAGIPIDMVGGTSIGSVGASMCALDLDPSKALHRMRPSFTSKLFSDHTLPFTSLLTGAKVSKSYQEWYGETCIEDLWLPYFCVSCNLSRAELFIHERGPLWSAVRASTAIPGVFSPLLHQGDLLVDGGLINNFPADVMHQRFQPKVMIGVHLSPLQANSEQYDFGPSLSGWKILWHRLNPFTQPLPVPSLKNILLRSLDIHSIQTIRSAQGLVDLLIEPDVEHVRADDYDAFDAIQELGYQAACKALTEWNPTKYGL